MNNSLAITAIAPALHAEARSHFTRMAAATVVALLTVLVPAVGADTTAASTHLVRAINVGAAVDAVTAAGGEVTDALGSLGMAVAELSPTQASRVARDARVAGVTPDGEVELFSNFSPIASEEWSSDSHTTMAIVNEAIGADKLHRKGIDGTGIDVAMIDSGVVPVAGLDPARVINGPDLSFESTVEEIRYLDTFGHGTHLGGIIAANSSEITGVAPDSDLVSLKVAAHDGATDVSQVLAAINWVIEHRNDNGLNIRVLNLAFGTDGIQDYLLDPLTYAVEVAWHQGIVAVVSAGNEGANARLRNPAYDPYVLAVGAADLNGTADVSDDTVADFSSWGTADRRVDLVAPGVSVASLRNPGSYADEMFPSARVGDNLFRGSGTSQATAVVSGAAALLLEAKPNLTPDQVKTLLKTSATPISLSPSESQGAGRIDVNNAVNRADLSNSQKKAADAVQTFPVATGEGSLELARGSVHVTDEGADLVGEVDIMGDAWDGRTWAGRTWTGSTWTGGDWMGRTWAGSSWTGSSWTGRTWAGSSWTGRTWTGSSWTGSSWTGSSWTGRTWTGSSWTGSSWTGITWAGSSWTGRGWVGRSWTSAWQ